MTDEQINEQIAEDPSAYTPPTGELNAIKAELRSLNEYVGPDRRPEDRLHRDAELLHLHRHGGIAVETLCMMLTDMEYAEDALRRAMTGGPSSPRPRRKIEDIVTQQTGMTPDERDYVG